MCRTIAQNFLPSWKTRGSFILVALTQLWCQIFQVRSAFLLVLHSSCTLSDPPRYLPLFAHRFVPGVSPVAEYFLKPLMLALIPDCGFHWSRFCGVRLFESEAAGYSPHSLQWPLSTAFLIRQLQCRYLRLGRRFGQNRRLMPTWCASSTDLTRFWFSSIDGVGKPLAFALHPFLPRLFAFAR